MDAGAVNANRNFLLLTSLGTGPTPLGPLSVAVSIDPWFGDALPQILAGNPFFAGWTVLILKDHRTELFQLTQEERGALMAM